MRDNNNVLGPGSIFRELLEGQKCDYEQKFCFNKEALDEFIKKCNQAKQQLSQSQFLQQCLSPDDFQKLRSSDLVDECLAAKIFIAINNSAGHVTGGKNGHHIGVKPFDIGGEDFAGAFFNLVGVSTEKTLYLEKTEIATHRNIDGNIFGDNRNTFCKSLEERQAVVKMQLQEAIDLLGEKDSGVKQNIQDFLCKLNIGYPNDKDKEEAQKACDLANLVRAIYIAKEDEITVFQRPNLFNVIKEEPEIFSQRVQAVVDATNKPIIVGKELYQPNKDKVLLDNFNGRMCDITNSEHITILKNKAGQLKPVFCLNGATHQMAPGVMENWAPSVGKNFKTSEEKSYLPLEEAMRKAQQATVYNKTGEKESVAVSYSVGGGQSMPIGKVPIVDRSIQILEAKIDEFCRTNQLGDSFDDALKNGIFKLTKQQYIQFSDGKHGVELGIGWTKLMQTLPRGLIQNLRERITSVSAPAPAPAEAGASAPAPAQAGAQHQHKREKLLLRGAQIPATTCCCFDCQYLWEYIKNSFACFRGGDSGAGR